MKKMYLKNINILFIFFMIVSSNVYSAAKSVNHFDVWEYVIDGNTLLGKNLIQSALSPYLGVGKSIKVVEQARDNLQRLYKQNDYPIVVVQIPQQNVVAGVVKLKVIEGKIERTKISGNHYFSRRDMKKELPSLMPGYPLNMSMVREEIDSLNKRNSYMKVTPIIRPGRKAGTMEMEIKVKDSLPLWAYVETNNRYTSLTTETRAIVSSGYENLWQKNHAFSVSYMASPEKPDEISTWSFNYSLPTGRDSKLALFAMNSDSRVGFSSNRDNVLVQGTGNTIGLRNVYSFQNRPMSNHVFILGMDYKFFNDRVIVSNEDNLQEVPIPIKYMAFTIGYNGFSRAMSSSNGFNVAANFGVRGLNNQDKQFDFKRFSANSNYFYVTAGFLQDNMFAKNWRLNYSLKGQYTASALISNEQISAGGVSSVRGYTESVVLGDYGVLGKVEVFYQPDLKRYGLSKLFMSAYVDGASLGVKNSIVADAVGNIQNRFDLLGVGVGIGMMMNKKFNMNIYYAKPKKSLDTDTFSNNPLLHFSLSAKF